MKVTLDKVLGDCGGTMSGSAENKIHLSGAPPAKAMVITLLSHDYGKHSLMAPCTLGNSTHVTMLYCAGFFVKIRCQLQYILKYFSHSLYGPSLLACPFLFLKGFRSEDTYMLLLDGLWFMKSALIPDINLYNRIPQPGCHSRDPFWWT